MSTARAGNDDEKMYMPSLKVEGGSAAKLAQAVRCRPQLAPSAIQASVPLTWVYVATYMLFYL